MGEGPVTPVEGKVKAGTAAAAVAGLLLWVLGRYVFKGAVPDVVASWVYAAVPAAVTFAAGYLAKHTPRPDIQVPASKQPNPAGAPESVPPMTSLPPTAQDTQRMLGRPEMAATHDQILTAVNRLAAKADVILQEMGIVLSQQDEINQDTQAIAQAVTDLGSAVTAVQAEIDALKAANPALDLSALDAAVASLSPAVQGVQGLVPPAP